MLNTRKIKLSFVTCVYKDQYNFERTMRSIEEYRNLVDDEELFIEHIVVCSDKTFDFSSEIIPITVYYQEPKGISAAFNYGIERSNGDYIWILNCGDVLQVKNLAILLNLMRCKPNLIVLDGYDSLARQKISSNIYRLMYGMYVFHPGLVVNKNIYKNYGMFDLDFKIAMDYDWLCKLPLNKLSVIYGNSVSVIIEGWGKSGKLGIRHLYELLKIGWAYKNYHILIFIIKKILHKIK